MHAQFIASPTGLGLAVEAGLQAFRARRGKIGGKISVKCQSAKGRRQNSHIQTTKSHL